jgi:outer membrane protein
MQSENMIDQGGTSRVQCLVRRWRILGVLLWFTLVGVAALTHADELPMIRSVTVAPEHVVLLLSAPASVRQAALPADPGRGLPDRCYVDVSPASLGSQVRPILDVNASSLRRVRASQFRSSTVRVVLDLFSPQLCRVSVLSDPDRVQVAVGSTPGEVVKELSEAKSPIMLTSAHPSASPARATVAASPTEVPEKRLAQQNGHGPAPEAAAPTETPPLPVERPAASSSTPVAAVAEEPGGQTLSLEEAYRLTLVNEEQIKIAASELAKAHLLPWRAVSLLSPTANILGTYLRNKEEISFIRSGADVQPQPGSPVGITTSVIRPLESWQGLFTATQPIIQPSFPPSWQLGKNAVQQNQQLYGFTTREVLFGVAGAYYNVLRAQEQVRVTQDTLRLTQDELRQAQARFRVGEVTKTDVLRAEVEVSRTERTLVTNQNTLQYSFTVLARAVGVKEPLRVIEPTPLAAGREGYELLLEKAYKYRQDFRAQEAAVEVARQRKNLVIARYFPQVSTQWQYSRLNTPTFSNPDRFWTMFLNFQLPLFDGGVRELDLQDQQENLAQAQWQLDRLRKDIGVEVKQAFLAVQTLGANLETLKKEVSLAQENYNITSKQYGVGLSTSLDVNSALNNLNQVRTQLTDQTYAYQVALLALDKAVGVFADDYVPQR